MKKLIGESVQRKLESLKIDWQYADRYAERGYSVGEKKWGILFADWNGLEDKAKGLMNALKERCEIEWSDEWLICDCGKAFRTQGDSYSWTMYGWISDGEYLCGDCVKEDPEEYEKYLMNNAKNVDSIGIDWKERGWRRLNEDDFESGFHAHMDDDPKEIMKRYRKEKPGMDFLFDSFEASQFYVRYAIWGKDKETEVEA